MIRRQALKRMAREVANCLLNQGLDEQKKIWKCAIDVLVHSLGDKVRKVYLAAFRYLFFSYKLIFYE